MSPASSAIRCCFVRTFPDSNASPVLPNNSPISRHSPSLLRLSSGRIRRPPRYYDRAKTPSCLPTSLRCLRSAVPPASPLFVSPVGLQRGPILTGLDVSGSSPWPPLRHRFLVEQYGPPRFLGSPLVPLPRSRTPAAPALRCHCRNQVLPPHTERRRPQHSTDFRGSITRLQHSLSTLPASAFPTLARLASGGWQALSGWDLNPLDSIANFMYGGYSILSQRSRLGLAPSVTL